jgi:hypothetical protein
MAGIKDDSNLGSIVTNTRQNDSSGRDTIDKIGCAINGVDDLGKARIAGFRVMFFTHDAVIGKGFFKASADKQFHFFVSTAYKILVAIPFDIPIGYVMKEFQG